MRILYIKDGVVYIDKLDLGVEGVFDAIFVGEKVTKAEWDLEGMRRLHFSNGAILQLPPGPSPSVDVKLLTLTGPETGEVEDAEI